MNIIGTETTTETTSQRAAPGAFEKFWKAYPRHTNRKKAQEAFQRLKVGETLLATMLTAITVQLQTDQWKRGVIPHASTWLNQHRWKDEVIAATTQPIDTTCRRILPGTSQRCGMPGKPHPVYGFSCEHCNRKDEEAQRSHEMPAHVRAALKLPKRERATT